MLFKYCIFRPVWYFPLLLFLLLLIQLFLLPSFLYSSLPPSSSQVAATLQTLIRSPAAPTAPRRPRSQDKPCVWKLSFITGHHKATGPAKLLPWAGWGKGWAECRKEGRKGGKEGWRRLRCKASSQMRLSWVGQLGWAGASMGQQAELPSGGDEIGGEKVERGGGKKDWEKLWVA